MSTTYCLSITDQTPTPIRPLGPVDYLGKGAHMRNTSPVAAARRGVDRHTAGVIWVTAILAGLLTGLVTDAGPPTGRLDQPPVVAGAPATTVAPEPAAVHSADTGTRAPSTAAEPVRPGPDTVVDITPVTATDTSAPTTEPAPTTTSTSTTSTTDTTLDIPEVTVTTLDVPTVPTVGPTTSSTEPPTTTPNPG